MRLVVALGNPGRQYQNTRHSVGFLVVDELQKARLPKGVVVKKSDTFMNDSGSFVKSLYTKYHILNTDLYIIHDDLDLPLGTWKISWAKGPKDHGGVNDIEQKLGSKDFWRIRVGVDSRNPESRVPGEDYVLQDFTKEEGEMLDGVIKEICKELVTRLKNIN